MSSHVRVTVAIVVALAFQASRQPPGDPLVGTGALSGRVITAGQDAEAVRGARVLLETGVRSQNRTATTDANGQFNFKGLAPGRYTLQATKPPFLPQFFGASRLGRAGTPIVLGHGESLDGLTIRMTLGAVVEGRIVDQDAEPVVGAVVSPMRLVHSAVSGQLTLLPAESVHTDTKGSFRVAGLMPGDYVIVGRPPEDLAGMTLGRVSALSSADIDYSLRGRGAASSDRGTALGTPVTWSAIYYPGTTDFASATRVTIQASEERVGLDFPLTMQPAGNLSGSVATPDNVSPAAVEITLLPSDTVVTAETLRFRGSTRASADGRYSFGTVPPGSYMLQARSGLASGGRSTIQARQAPVLWANALVSVHGQDLTVPLVMQPAFRIAGSLDMLGRGPLSPSDLADIQVILEPPPETSRGSRRHGSSVTQRSTFSFDGLVPGTFLLRLSAGSGRQWYVLSTKHSGRETIDILDVAGATDDITVTITDTPSELTGTLVDSSGRPATDYFIVVFSTNRKYWTDQSRRIREVRPATDGSYVCRNLPKGDYFVAVLADLAPGEAFDSTFLDSLVTAAQVVTIADGIKTSQSFRIGG